MLGLVLTTGIVWALAAQPTNPSPGRSVSKSLKPFMSFPVQKSEAEWRRLLTPEQYRILRLKETERAFTGAYWNHKEQGIYRCAGCGAVLFTSEAKYDSGCGWPSYHSPASPEAIRTQPDYSHGMVRTEVVCAQCGGHLGHVFPDGPKPTGLRYCINSAALHFQKTVQGKR